MAILILIYAIGENVGIDSEEQKHRPEASRPSAQRYQMSGMVGDEESLEAKTDCSIDIAD